MPGSPPTSTTEPGTNPPPRTRLSSDSPVSMRECESEGTSERWTGTGTGTDEGARLGPLLAGAASSMIVFHWPQPGQRPSQPGALYPHS